MNLRERIYSIMEDKNMCQAAVARAAGYTPKRFNNMLRGRALITADDIPDICIALNTSPNDLFADVDTKAV